MSPQLWERLLVAARSCHDRNVLRFGGNTTRIVLHGGEPFAAPLSYLKELMEIYRRVIGESPHFSVGVQTNLYRITDEQIAFLKEHAISPGVSFDVVGGVRRSLSGRETEAAVQRNMERLAANGVQFGAIAVLARHTAPRLREVYDFFADRGIPLRVLPLSEGPGERPEALFSLPNADLVAALQDLFVHWIETGRRVPVSPFDDYITAAARKIIGIRDAMWSRRNDGEGVLVVNTNGRLYRMDDLYEEEALIGDIASQSMEEIVASVRYARSLAFDEDLTARMCGGCAFEGACTGVPALSSKHGALHDGRCAIAYPMHQFVENYLREQGFTKPELTELLGLEVLDAA
jgi:uncharacterized protein